MAASVWFQRAAERDGETTTGAKAPVVLLRRAQGPSIFYCCFGIPPSNTAIFCLAGLIDGFAGCDTDGVGAALGS